MSVIDKHGTVDRVVLHGHGLTYLGRALELIIGIDGTCDDMVVTRGPANQMRLVLWRRGKLSAHSLPAPVHVAAVLPLVSAWLDNAEHPSPQPDTDGTVKRGWAVLGPGIADVDHFALGAVEPCWIVYGK